MKTSWLAGLPPSVNKVLNELIDKADHMNQFRIIKKELADEMSLSAASVQDAFATLQKFGCLVEYETTLGMRFMLSPAICKKTATAKETAELLRRWQQRFDLQNAEQIINRIPAGQPMPEPVSID